MQLVGGKGPLLLATFRQVVEVHLVGTFNVLRLAAERMTAQQPGDDGDFGVVVVTASIAAHDGQVGQAARDLADKGIRVATIAPGTMETPMLAGLPEETRTVLEQQVPHPSAPPSTPPWSAIFSTTNSSTAK